MSVWSTAPFAALYDSIVRNEHETKQTLAQELADSLVSLLLVKERCENSRKVLETGELKLSNGNTYSINQTFIENTIKLAEELEIDELVAAEIFYFASSNELDQLGTSYYDSAVTAYYNRRNYILQIVSYYLCFRDDSSSDSMVDDSKKDQSLTRLSPEDKKCFIEQLEKTKNYSVTHILASFKQLEKELDSIKKNIERSKMLGSYHQNLPEFKRLQFRRDIIYKQYQLLSEVMFGYVVSFCSNPDLFSTSNFIEILNHVTTFKPQDIFSLSYIPALFTYVSSLEILPQTSVESLQKELMKEANDIEKLSEVPLKALIILVFLTYFIDWCKKETSRSSKFDFTTSIDEPMQKCISVGALEQFLAVTIEISLVESSTLNIIKPFYDFKTFLQQHVPKYEPIRLFDTDEIATQKLKNVLEQKRLSGAEVSDAEFITIYEINNDFKLCDNFVDFMVPVLSNFVHAFISTAAFMMTQLRDAEEDLLLSSETFDLDGFAESADLERLYISMYYLYMGRPQYCSKFWDDVSSASYGFLQWASRCNSPLIMATFSMVLSSLASGEENAVNVFGFLQSTNSNNSFNLLSSSKGNSTLLTRYPSISWSTIYSTLLYYNDALTKASDPITQNITNESFISASKSKRPVVTELGEDSIIYISGFFQVLSTVAYNSSKARSELLESDNHQLFTILTNLLNMNTSLGGSIMSLLSALVGDNYTERSKFWNTLDDWLFKGTKSSFISSISDDVFSKKLINYDFVSGFIDLVSRLLQPLNTSSDPNKPITLPFSRDFGGHSRKPGVWCYIHYLCLDVLPELEYSEVDQNRKNLMKYSILKLMNFCVSEIDPNLTNNVSACSISNIDSIVSNATIIEYLQLHPGSAILTYMYDSKVHESLFQICNMGIDKLNALSTDAIEVELLYQSMKMIEMTLEREPFFAGELLSILRLPDNPFTSPSDIGMSGLHSFYQTFLLNLPVLANYFLYVGSDKKKISCMAISIISKISSSATVINQKRISRMNKDHLLLMCENIDESIRIRSAFIEQFDAPALEPENIATKIQMLEFINNTIQLKNKEISIGHFLLGFNTREMNLGSPDQDTTIMSGRSLLQSITNVLRETVDTLSETNNVEYGSVRLSTVGMEILLKLCKSDMTGKMILNYLRTGGDMIHFIERNFILFLIEKTQKLHISMHFSGKAFDGYVSSSNHFFSSGTSICSLNSFLEFRSFLVQLIAIEIHVTSLYGSNSLNKEYLRKLTRSFGFSSGSSKLLNMLDVLDFKTYNMIEKVGKVFSSFDFNYIFNNIELKSKHVPEENETPYDLSIVDAMVRVYCKDPKNVIASEQSLEMESRKLKMLLTASISFDSFKILSYNYLKSWILLVQVVITEVDMKVSERASFILEILQGVLPKMDQYFEDDIGLAEELAILCVRLVHIYNADKNQLFTTIEEKQAKSLFDFERFFSILKVSIHGISMAASSHLLRSDLYILITEFLEQLLYNETVVKNVVTFLKSIDPGIFDIICHDSLIGEGTTRISSLTLLETFAKVFIQDDPQALWIFDIMCKNNYLQLLAQKLKSTDQVFMKALDGNSKKSTVTIQELLYELTIFKACVSLLTRVSQTRLGAQQLLRCGIFTIITECGFLQLDADLGFDLHLKEFSASSIFASEKYTTMNVSLDYPLGFKTDQTTGSGPQLAGLVTKDNVSYYEIFIPVFQLVTTIAISLGPKNSLCLYQLSALEKHFEKLIAAILKREILYENYHEGRSESAVETFIEKDGPFSSYNVKGIRELSNLFTLLNSLL